MFTNRITKLINGLPGWPYWDGLSASSTGQCHNAYTATGEHHRAAANSAQPRPPAAGRSSLSFQATFSNESHAPACPSCGHARGDVVEEPAGRLFDEIVGHGRKRDHSEKIADAQQIHQPHIFNVQQVHRIVEIRKFEKMNH